VPGRLRVEGPVGTETLAKIDQHVAPELPDQPGAAAAVFDLTGRVNEHVTGQNVRPVLTSGCADRVYLTGRHVQILRSTVHPARVNCTLRTPCRVSPVYDIPAFWIVRAGNTPRKTTSSR
jgi:hypothetical protein